MQMRIAVEKCSAFELTNCRNHLFRYTLADYKLSVVNDILVNDRVEVSHLVTIRSHNKCMFLVQFSSVNNQKYHSPNRIIRTWNCLP
jgi:hypothetical protein